MSIAPPLDAELPSNVESDTVSVAASTAAAAKPPWPQPGRNLTPLLPARVIRTPSSARSARASMAVKSASSPSIVPPVIVRGSVTVRPPPSTTVWPFRRTVSAPGLPLAASTAARSAASVGASTEKVVACAVAGTASAKQKMTAPVQFRRIPYSVRG